MGLIFSSMIVVPAAKSSIHADDSSWTNCPRVTAIGRNICEYTSAREAGSSAGPRPHDEKARRTSWNKLTATKVEYQAMTSARHVTAAPQTTRQPQPAHSANL